LRVPRWCNGASISVNGVKQNSSCASGSWAKIQRKWNAGDRVRFEIPMRPVFVRVDAQHPKRVAILHGPVLLVRKSAPALPLTGRDPSTLLAPSGKPLEFEARAKTAALFEPYYRIGHLETYDTYFDLA
jgi:uncharacterized protein